MLCKLVHFAAENAQDELLLKNDFLNFSRYSSYILQVWRTKGKTLVKYLQDSV